MAACHERVGWMISCGCFVRESLMFEKITAALAIRDKGMYRVSVSEIGLDFFGR